VGEDGRVAPDLGPGPETANVCQQAYGHRRAPRGAFLASINAPIVAISAVGRQKGACMMGRTCVIRGHLP
jgi:hypothetical protein